MKVFFGFILLVGCSLFVWSCDHNIACEEALNITKFEVGIDYCLTEYKTIAIDSISDYRCPTSVVCVWAGAVDVYFRILDQDALSPFNVHVPNDGMPFVIPNENGYKFTIKGISPYPDSPEATPQSDFEVNMIIEKAN